MKRQEAFDAFGGAAALAKAVRVLSQSVYQWPKSGQLTAVQADRVLAAMLRAGKPIPKAWLK